jgi:hypothetical protein
MFKMRPNGLKIEELRAKANAEGILLPPLLPAPSVIKRRGRSRSKACAVLSALHATDR